MGQTNGQKVLKNAKKSQNTFHITSTFSKLLSEVEPYWTINNEVHVAKKCYQICQKVAKVAKKCYKMWQKVAKGALSGSKRFQGLPRATGYHGLPRAPTVFQREVSRGIPRESATGCGKKSPKGFHRTRAQAPACRPKASRLVLYM